MPRPKNKQDLLDLSEKNFVDLISLIESFSTEDQNKEFPKGTLNRNIRDVLMHLHHWHVMFQEWHKIGMTGKKPEMPAKGYSWKTTPELNRWIHQKYQDVTVDTAIGELKKSYEVIRSIIHNYSNEDLFEKKKYKWTGSTSMGSYLVSVSSSHYDWAIKLIKKQMKNE